MKEIPQKCPWYSSAQAFYNLKPALEDFSIYESLQATSADLPKPIILERQWLKTANENDVFKPLATFNVELNDYGKHPKGNGQCDRINNTIIGKL